MLFGGLFGSALAFVFGVGVAVLLRRHPGHLLELVLEVGLGGKAEQGRDFDQRLIGEAEEFLASTSIWLKMTTGRGHIYFEGNHECVYAAKLSDDFTETVGEKVAGSEQLIAVSDRWNQLNLYQITRGINRFDGFARILKEYFPEDKDVLAFDQFVKSAKTLSPKALEEEYKLRPNPLILKALEWSKRVNQTIVSLPPEDVRPFDGAKEGLAFAQEEGYDVAIVSSANFEAVRDEWSKHGLLDHVDCMTSQNDGTKLHCIQVLLSKGYDPEKVIMAGDAKGDLEAAGGAGVNFYPILVRKEVESWQKMPGFLARFKRGDAKAEIDELETAFYENFQD